MFLRLKSILTGAGAIALATIPLISSADTAVTVDHDHTSAAFTVSHLTITKVTGTIPVADATMSVAPNEMPTAVKISFDLAKITTQNEKRDADLRSDHWFNVASTPDMSFVATKVTPGADGAFIMTGNLTMHGVTKPVTLTGKYEGKVELQGRTHLGYTATTKLDRTQWNVGAFPPAIVGNDISIQIELEAIAN